MNMFSCSFLRKATALFFTGTFWMLSLLGCTTTNKPFSSFDTLPAPTQPGIHQPSSSQDYSGIRNSFAANLPLGIGTRIDFFLSEASDQVSSVYNSYVKPYRKGKIFREKPYELNYSILPKKGESFNLHSPLNNVTIRSDYDFRIGMSRRFKNFSDFLNPDFFLAKGRFSPEFNDEPLDTATEPTETDNRTSDSTLPDLPKNSDTIIQMLLEEPINNPSGEDS